MQKSGLVTVSIIFLVVGFATVEAAESKIPEWVKNTALWYGEDKISESEFISAIQFLIQNKIIVLDEAESPKSFVEPESEKPQEKLPTDCSGNARCISGFVTKIIDGDTIKVDGLSIRFSLVDTPEYGKYGFNEAREFVESICPVGTEVLVDEDDGQTQGSYGRIIAKIYCNGVILNEEVLEKGHAKLSSSFCTKSEFLADSWAQRHGCPTAIPQINLPQVKQPSQSYSTIKIIIAEAESNPEGTDQGNEWIKLYNPTGTKQDISNWKIQSTHGKTETYQVPSGTVIDSCGYHTIRFSSQFLDNEDESAILLDQNGSVIDQTPVFSDKSNDGTTWRTNIPSCK